jgi:hypothetical protein
MMTTHIMHYQLKLMIERLVLIQGILIGDLLPSSLPFPLLPQHDRRDYTIAIHRQQA